MAASRKQQIVFLDQSTLPIALPAFSFPHEIVVYDLTSAEQVAERIAQADIVLSNKVAIAAEHIAAAPNLRIIGVPAVGLDHICIQCIRLCFRRRGRTCLDDDAGFAP